MHYSLSSLCLCAITDANLAGSKRSRREILDEKNEEARMTRNQKLMNTPIKKWPLTEYTRFRARYHFDKPRDPTAHEYFHLSVHQMIYEQCYVGNQHSVAPMHTINISHMDEHAEYFAEAKAVCE